MTVRQGFGLMSTASRLVWAPVDEGSGGAPGAGGGLGLPVPGAEAAAAAAAPESPDPAAVKAAPDPAAGTILGDARADDAPVPETAEQKAAREATEAAAAAAAETPEAKAARIAEERAAETPEAKAAREATEATERAEALKVYDVLTLPEGMPKEQPAYENFVAAALDAGVEPAVAQKMLDAVAPELQKAINAPFETWATTVVGWKETCERDPEFGGASYKQNMGIAARGIDAIAGTNAPAFRDMLLFTGIGNNPEFIRFVYRAGKMVTEGSPVLGSGVVEKVPLAERMYPDMVKS